MFQSYKSVFRFGSFLLSFFAGSAFAQQAPSNQKIDNCLKTNKCIVQLRGEATANPVMSFIVAEETWATFDEKDKSDVRLLLRQKIEQAKTQPGAYTEYPNFRPILSQGVGEHQEYEVVFCYSVERSKFERSAVC
jgi:hypothetical protein